MPEQLLTCPTCQTTGFTPRGLKAHRCKGENRNPSPATGLIEAQAPSVPSVPLVPSIPEINALHREASYLADLARAVGSTATHKAILIGLKLSALKEATPHGQWESLFASGAKRTGKPNAKHDSHLLEFDSRTACNYISVAAQMISQRLTAEQSAALMELARRPDGGDLGEAETSFLDELVPEKSLRQLYLSMGIIKPTRREAYAMDAGEWTAAPAGDAEKTPRRCSLAEAMQARKDAARRDWFGIVDAGMVKPGSVMGYLRAEASNPAEAQLNHLSKPDLIEIEETLKPLLKLCKQLIAES